MAANRKKSAPNEKVKTASVASVAAPWRLLVSILGPGGVEWIKSMLIAILVALAIRWAFVEPFRIPSGSMEPTFYGDPHILKGDRVFVNKFVYGLRYPLNGIRIPLTNYHLNYAKDRIWRRSKPQRWDIVVFKSVEENAVHTTLVKRVVGLPSERIHIANGKVYANGVPLELPPDMPPVQYTSPRPGYSTDMKYGILTEDAYSVVPENSYLLLGDNSSQSRDGRYFGWVPYERILGRVSCIWLPIIRRRDFTGFSRTWWWQTVVAVVGVLFVGRVFFGRSWRYERGGKSNHAYIDRWAYGLPAPFTKLRLMSWGQPRRGDLVLYRPPKEGKDIPHYLVGRIAGLPGERVFLDGGKLEVNGAPVGSPVLAERLFPSGDGVGPYARSKGKEYSLVPEGRVFILTEDDDPEAHLDSRTVGWVPRAKLVGRGTAVWWPPHRVGRPS
ncbi:MAG TPA: signal peptidase I [Candidatus Bathyarchaeia archaeon]|nr:signal peptidase I [Candidatus Bathyarchaeia archaeon]